MTTTSWAPAAVAAVVAVISVSETTVTEVAELPILTVAGETKPLPLILTEVPPAVGPWVGLMRLHVGTAT